ncbi:hypothetical protein Ahy_A05g024074 [Arachis hypogaea]|uniref:Uncharacterized protein n=1 Tax=Arachis hypogaea TaxID=3818 RepID=A0A445D545_ARAHY|nr:hypothetical protein Ahy_A05g024074 [Arachis hypogaea]
MTSPTIKSTRKWEPTSVQNLLFKVVLKGHQARHREQLHSHHGTQRFVINTFNGASFEWILISCQVEFSRIFHKPRTSTPPSTRSFVPWKLTFHKKHMAVVLNTYLSHLLKEAKLMKHEEKSLWIFMVDYENMYKNVSDAWVRINLNHSATLEMVSLDEGVKELTVKDLERVL